MYLPQTSSRDLEVFLQVSLPNAVVGARRSAGAFLMLRRQGGKRHHRLGLVLRRGDVFLRGRTSSGKRLFNDVRLGRSFKGDVFKVRVRLEGASPTLVKARGWRKGTPEPEGWTHTTSNRGPQVAGSIGIWSFSTSRARMEMRFDNLLAKQL